MRRSLGRHTFSSSLTFLLSLFCHLQLQDTALISSISCSHRDIQKWWFLSCISLQYGGEPFPEVPARPSLGYLGTCDLALVAREASGQNYNLSRLHHFQVDKSDIPCHQDICLPMLWLTQRFEVRWKRSNQKGAARQSLASRPLQLRAQEITNSNSRNLRGGQEQRHIERKCHNLVLHHSVKQKRRQECFSAGIWGKRQRWMT